jgi:hypothetical protein
MPMIAKRANRRDCGDTYGIPSPGYEGMYWVRRGTSSRTNPMVFSRDVSKSPPAGHSHATMMTAPFVRRRVIAFHTMYAFARYISATIRPLRSVPEDKPARDSAVAHDLVDRDRFRSEAKLQWRCDCTESVAQVSEWVLRGDNPGWNRVRGARGIEPSACTH